MRNIKLKIEYDGTNYKGWQKQKNTPMTIQGVLDSAILKLTGNEPQIIGSGRTDSGVHALGQVANFKTSSKMPADKIKNAINAYLPKDIVVLNAEEVSQDFHAQHDAKWKTYRYCISNRDERPAISSSYVYHWPHHFRQRFLLKEVLCLTGRHDFKSFAAKDVSKPHRNEDTIRTIKTISIHKRMNLITIEITADGFLFKMVRNIVGTLLEISRKNLPPGTLLRILKAKSREKGGPTAPAHGLTLLEVCY